jgi:hypothetical protein
MLYLLAMLFSVVGLLMLWIRLRYSLLLLAVIGLNLTLLAVSFGLHRSGNDGDRVLAENDGEAEGTGTPASPDSQG